MIVSVYQLEKPNNIFWRTFSVSMLKLTVRATSATFSHVLINPTYTTRNHQPRHAMFSLLPSFLCRTSASGWLGPISQPSCKNNEPGAKFPRSSSMTCCSTVAARRPCHRVHNCTFSQPKAGTTVDGFTGIRQPNQKVEFRTWLIRVLVCFPLAISK